MKTFQKTIRWMSSQQCLMSRANFSSGNNPIKMAHDVFSTGATDRNAPPLVIMHGLFGSKQNWRTIGRGLGKKTNRVIYTVDARNHGNSPHDPVHTSRLMSEDIVLFMKDKGVSKISVMGHSMGGRAMMYFTLKYPEMVDKPIIVDISPVSIPSNLDFLNEVLLAMKRVSVSSKLTMAQGRAAAEKQLRDALGDVGIIDFVMLNLMKLPNGEFVWGLNVEALQTNLGQFRDTGQFHMPPYTKPALFIAGEHSDFLPREDWPKILEIFPNAKLELLDAGHLIHFEQPEKFMEVVTDFLKS